MDPFWEFAWLLLVSVGAHVTIAWTSIARHARIQEAKWEKKVKEEFIPNATTDAVAKLELRLPPAPVIPTTAEIAEAVTASLPEPPALITPEEISAIVRQEIQRIDVPNANAIVGEVTDHVRELLENLDFSEVAKAVWERVEAGFEGKGGAAITNANKSLGVEILTQLAAYDLGNPVLNGIWVSFLKARGPWLVQLIGRYGRRIPILGDAFAEQVPEEGGLSELDSSTGGGSLVYPGMR